jgi:hypothetical protein
MDAAMIVTLCDISETRFGRLHDADRCHGRLDYKVLLLRIKMLLHSTDSESANLVGWGWPISMHRQEGATQLMPLKAKVKHKAIVRLSYCGKQPFLLVAVFKFSPGLVTFSHLGSTHSLPISMPQVGECSVMFSSLHDMHPSMKHLGIFLMALAILLVVFQKGSGTSQPLYSNERQPCSIMTIQRSQTRMDS